MRFDQGQAGAEIEITPAMIEAGVLALREWGGIEHPNLVSAEVVEAVLRVALGARYKISVREDG